jgi:hypothetical protein
MSNTQKFFILQQHGQNLDSKDYAACLIFLQYNELNNVLNGMQEVRFGSRDKSGLWQTVEDQFNIGEHAIVATASQKPVITWTLCVVQQHGEDDGAIIVLYLVPIDDTKISWIFPEEAKLISVLKDDIVVRKVAPSYHKTAMIRISIAEETVQQGHTSLSSLQFNLSFLQYSPYMYLLFVDILV